MELGKVKAFIDEAKKKNLPDAQIARYEALQKDLENCCKENQNLAHVFKRAETLPGATEYFSVFFDNLNEDGDSTYIAKLSDSVFNKDLDPYVGIPTGYLFCRKHPQYTPDLTELSVYNRGADTPEAIERCERKRLCMKEMMKDPCVGKNISYIGNQGRNPNLYSIWAKTVDTPDGFDVPKEAAPVVESTIETPFINGFGDEIEAIFESVEDQDTKGAITCNNYDYLHRVESYLKAYETYLEEAIELGDITETSSEYMYVEEKLDEVESALYFMEWEADGSPDPVLATHIMTTKEREELAKKKEEEKNSLNPSSTSKGALRSEKESLDIISEAQKKLEKLKSLKDKKDAEKQANEIREDLLEEIKREASEYQNVSEALKDFDTDYEMTFEEAGEEDDDIKDDNTGDVNTDNNDPKQDNSLKAKIKDIPKNDKPKKPKEDLATKVQNKALDTDAKLTQKESELDEKAQKLVNAGKAVGQHPKKLADDAGGLLANFDKWDDNRRKKFLLKPGYRHKIFKKFRVALEYGIAANISVMSIPMLWSIRHLSKQKDKRIRNELAMELDNEIRICEEKINDANAQGDNKTKYELMRIKDKLDAERKRVRLNSKYV
jgi:hypothetical protein